VLREDQLAVRGDVENPVVALDELGLRAERLLDLGRHTAGLRQVVSAHAVGDGDAHGDRHSGSGIILRAVRSRCPLYRMRFPRPVRRAVRRPVAGKERAPK